MDDPAATERGRVAAYRPTRGFGVIAPDHEGGRLFVRTEDVVDEDPDLVPGEAVEYRTAVGVEGQLTAVAVRRVRRGRRSGPA